MIYVHEHTWVKNMRKNVVKKKLCVVFTCVTLLIVAAVGCGGASDTSSAETAEYAVPQAVGGKALSKSANLNVAEDADNMSEAAVEGEAGGGEAPSENAEPVTDTSRKLITTMRIGAETENFDDAISTIEAKVGELGGYIESSDVYNGSNSNKNHSSSNRRASFVIRIPADNLGGFVDSLSDAYNITNKTTSVEDVTLQYVDIESKKKALLTEEESLLSILESAETVEDIITVQDRLSQVRYELENMESQLRAYDNQVDYSTVYLDLDEVAKYTPVEEKGAFARMGEGFVESLKSVCNGIKEFIIWFVIHIPQLLFLAIFVAVIWISCKKIKEKKASGVTNNAGIKSEAKEEKTTLEKAEGKDGK